MKRRKYNAFDRLHQHVQHPAEFLRLYGCLRPSHRKQYQWLFNQSSAIRLSEDAESEMSRYTGIYAYDAREAREKVVSDFGTKFHQSLSQFLSTIYALYGFDTLDYLDMWDSSATPAYLYRIMMDRWQHTSYDDVAF